MNHQGPTQSCDSLLLQQIAQGSTTAFETLFEKYWQNAYSDAFKRLKSHDDSKDIVQEIFTSIWINRETIHIQNLPAYLNIAIRNKVIKLVSRQKHYNPYFDILEKVPKESAKADSNLLWKEFCKSYEALVQSLPPKRQEIFRLRYQDDLRTRDIAEHLGIKLKTVQNQLGKAVDTLRVSLLRILSVLWLVYFFIKDK
ncbi:MAG: sigma-70 family RNA polymerase sigma factor [Ginsengibacter sp.]